MRIVFPDLILAGNNYSNRAEEGRLNAGRGLVLQGNSNGEFEELSATGFTASGDVRKLLVVQIPGGELIIVGRNDSFLDVYMRSHETN